MANLFLFSGKIPLCMCNRLDIHTAHIIIIKITKSDNVSRIVLALAWGFCNCLNHFIEKKKFTGFLFALFEVGSKQETKLEWFTSESYALLRI